MFNKDLLLSPLSVIQMLGFNVLFFGPFLTVIFQKEIILIYLKITSNVTQ